MKFLKVISYRAMQHFIHILSLDSIASYIKNPDCYIAVLALKVVSNSSREEIFLRNIRFVFIEHGERYSWHMSKYFLETSFRYSIIMKLQCHYPFVIFKFFIISIHVMDIGLIAVCIFWCARTISLCLFNLLMHL